MPIKGLSNVRRIPRLGKIRLGIKAPNKDGKGEHPVATDYFVLPKELQDALGVDKPQELEIMFPIEDDTIFAQQWYRQYSLYRGLTCKGDGITCGRLVDKQKGTIADRESKEVGWQDDLPCSGKECEDYTSRPQRCHEVMNLQFLIPTVKGIGVWQVDTGSINSILNINSSLEFLRRVYGRVSMIPLVLALVKQTVTNPDDNTKKTVSVLQLTAKFSMMELAQAAGKTAGHFLIPPPSTEEAPDDQSDDEDGTYPSDIRLEADNSKTAKKAPEAPWVVESTAKEVPPAQKVNPAPKELASDSRTGIDKALAEADRVLKENSGTPAHTPTPSEQESAKAWEKDIAGEKNPAEQKAATQPAIKPADAAPSKPAEATPKHVSIPVTAEHLKRLKELHENYHVNMTPYLRKRKINISLMNQLPDEDAMSVINEIKGELKKKGVL